MRRTFPLKFSIAHFNVEKLKPKSFLYLSIWTGFLTLSSVRKSSHLGLVINWVLKKLLKFGWVCTYDPVRPIFLQNGALPWPYLHCQVRKGESRDCVKKVIPGIRTVSFVWKLYFFSVGFSLKEAGRPSSIQSILKLSLAYLWSTDPVFLCTQPIQSQHFDTSAQLNWYVSTYCNAYSDCMHVFPKKKRKKWARAIVCVCS